MFNLHDNPDSEKPQSEEIGRFDTGEQSGGMVIVNADDWGRNAVTTDRSLDCVLRRRVSCVSAMLFMEDSERAADLAQHHGIDASLHLNFTLPFSSTSLPSRLKDYQNETSRFLRLHRFAPALYHPGLATRFEYLVQAQLEEYERLYGCLPKRVDGHHHMHLCSNVVFQRLMPDGTIVRRNLSFRSGEKGCLNLIYRSWENRQLARRHLMTDFFFDLQPLEPSQRLERIFQLGRRCDVEVETHVVNSEEFEFLLGDEFLRRLGGTKVAQGYYLRRLNGGAKIAAAI